MNQKVHTSHENFGAAAAEAEAESPYEIAKAKLKVEMQKVLDQAQKELNDGILHGLVVVRVNEEHEIAGSIAICSNATVKVASKIQDMSLELITQDAPPQIKSLLALLKRLEAGRG